MNHDVFVQNNSGHVSSAAGRAPVQGVHGVGRDQVQHLRGNPPAPAEPQTVHIGRNKAQFRPVNHSRSKDSAELAALTESAALEFIVPELREFFDSGLCWCG